MMKRFAAMMLGLALVGVAGCGGASNEKTAEITGTAPTGEAGTPPATNQGYQDYMKKQGQAQQKSYAQQGYPGAQ